MTDRDKTRWLRRLRRWLTEPTTPGAWDRPVVPQLRDYPVARRR